MQSAQCQNVVLIPECRIWCHISSVLEGYHKKLLCILLIISRLHPSVYQKLEGAVIFKMGVEVEGVEAEGVIAQCVIYLQCQWNMLII